MTVFDIVGFPNQYNDIKKIQLESTLIDLVKRILK